MAKFQPAPIKGLSIMFEVPHVKPQTLSVCVFGKFIADSVIVTKSRIYGLVKCKEKFVM